MRTIRLFFSKQAEAAYISHLDLQRVMARALRRSGLPAWYSLGFNPHIYLTFALPLPLAQESIAETMDCRTEAEDEDFTRFVPLLNAALPRGITVQRIAQPVHKAAEIAAAEYEISWPEQARPAVVAAVEEYNRRETAPVVRKTKRSQQTVDLKQHLPQLAVAPGAAPAVVVRLPAGGETNLNPALLADFLAGIGGPTPAAARILRAGVFVKDGQAFC